MAYDLKPLKLIIAARDTCLTERDGDLFLHRIDAVEIREQESSTIAARHDDTVPNGVKIVE
jgi:hypothetical protein